MGKKNGPVTLRGDVRLGKCERGGKFWPTAKKSTHKVGNLDGPLKTSKGAYPRWKGDDYGTEKSHSQRKSKKKVAH